MLFTDLNCILLNQYGYTWQIKWQPVFLAFVFSWPNAAWNVHFWTWWYLSMVKKTYLGCELCILHHQSSLRSVCNDRSALTDDSTAFYERNIADKPFMQLLCNMPTCSISLYFFFSFFSGRTKVKSSTTGSSSTLINTHWGCPVGVKI